MHVFLSQPALWGQGHLDIVKFLVENGANIHAENDYALTWSTYFGHTKVFDFLISMVATVKN